LYGGDLAFSGMSILGMPLPSLGHSRFCSIAMTTGGPDAADCYAEEINPDNPRQYRYDGKWRDITVRKETIRVKNGDSVKDQPVEIEYTHHGPIVAHKDGKAYALKLPYFDQVLLPDQVYKMITAKNLDEMKQAIGMLQLMEQNIMVATVDGDIYYVRNARVPIRAAGFDYKRPLPGNTSASEWLGIHPLEDLLQVHNPPQGYMQNCNVSPQFMMKDSPFQPQKWNERPYLFNGFTGDTQNRGDNPLHQRAAMCLELLDKADKLTVEQAMSIAHSYDVYGADVWQKMLGAAWKSAANTLNGNEQAKRMYELIVAWDRRTEADSTGAIAYKYWKDQFSPEVRLNDRAGFPPPKSVTEKDLLDNLDKGAQKLMADFGRLDVAFGDVYRTGRRGTNRTWPLGGGSVEGIATPRAVSFDRIEGTKQFLARGGQTSTQIVQMTNPPRSWTYLPLGESDHPESPHYDDQAEKLFSQAKMKSTYFLDKAELEKHVTSNKTLRRVVAAN
ncbi:MAG: penicillin acylase family protein, partial [Planctomycetaceae bacterium]